MSYLKTGTETETCPDWNKGLEKNKGRLDRLAANRAALCIISEYGLCNNRKMSPERFIKLVENVQDVFICRY